VPPDPFTIVLDFCNGGSLLSKIKSAEEIDQETELEWALDIATGMVLNSTFQKNLCYLTVESQGTSALRN
jgi:hypothetical protein